MNLNCGNYEVEKNSYEEVFLIKSRPESQQRTVMRSLNNATYVARCRSNWISIRYICTLASFRVARGTLGTQRVRAKGRGESVDAWLTLSRSNHPPCYHAARADLSTLKTIGNDSAWQFFKTSLLWYGSHLRDAPVIWKIISIAKWKRLKDTRG